MTDSSADEELEVMHLLCDLEIFKKGYPRAFFFRQSEFLGPGHRPGTCTFDGWDNIFARLSGIEGKVLEEEIHYPSGQSLTSNIDYFVRYKEKHPENLVLLHFNGRACDPNFFKNFYAGHWHYYEGCRITKDVPAEEGETDIYVENPSLFFANLSREGKNEDIGLCMLREDGKLDWNRSEQVQLISVKGSVIRVKRGCYGTKPVAFPANRSYAAAHVTEGPFGKESNLLWQYNFSPLCPKDPQGRTCNDVLVDNVASLLLPGGKLERFDGIEFDAMYHVIYRSYAYGRSVDTNGDGLPDNGWVDGRNYYGIGVYEFCRKLREKLGEEKLILADGAKVEMQRSFGVLNGIESEGWPRSSDWEKVREWSDGINRHLFWNQNAHKPTFSYVNHKWIKPRAPWGMVSLGEVPFNINRLVFAAAQFFDAAICYSHPPRPEPNETLGIWDELWMGVEHKLGWLGEPLGPPIRMALQTRDLLNRDGQKLPSDFLAQWQGEDVKFKIEKSSLEVSASNGNVQNLRFRLVGLRCAGPDLFVSLKIRAQPLKHYPRDIPRLVWARIPSDQTMNVMTWANDKWFGASFYFRDIKQQDIDLEFEVEGGEPIWLSDISVHEHPDAVYRMFERGIVLANPSYHEYSFDLSAITPNRKYRRLLGSSMQDTRTNDGSSAGKIVTLGPLDGLFLAVLDKGYEPQSAPPESSQSLPIIPTGTSAFYTLIRRFSSILGDLS